MSITQDGPARSPAEKARELKALGLLEDALVQHRLDVAERPASAVAEHNLASTLGDLSRFAEAAAAAQRAITKGITAPETWLVLARALQGMLRLDEAEAAYEAALALRPDYLDAHQDLAQLRWMRDGDLAGACTALERAIARGGPASTPLTIQCSRLEIAAGQPGQAVTRLEAALQRTPADPALYLATAQACAAAGQRDAHLAHAAGALRLAPSSQLAAKTAVEALLGLGQAQEAADLAGRILAHHPADQGVRVLHLTALRLLGDARGTTPYEDTGLVRQIEVPTPAGWSARADWLDELSRTLRARHGWAMHPPGQSLRGGSQTQEDLSRSDDPAIAGLFNSIRQVVTRYIAELGSGTDPTRARLQGMHTPPPWRFTGAWSVLLRAGGCHIDHVHPEGWLSSAFHVETVPAHNEDKQGWLAFGRPGCATSPALSPLFHVAPKPGHLVLFPSYLWHGTEPFDAPHERLSVAFDIVPGERG